MEHSFRILLIEDNQDDADLLKNHLNKLDLQFIFDVVESKKSLQKYLENHKPHLIVCDYNLLEFTGIDALEYLRKQNSGLPFILVSDYIGEERAVDAILKGASDFVLKDNLKRLGPAVKRVIFQHGERKETQEELDAANQDLKGRIKEQQCLVNISSLYNQKLPVPELLQKAVTYLPPGFRYPSLASASIQYDGEIYQTENFNETDSFLTASTTEVESGPLIVKVCYVKSKTEKDEKSFLNEERHFLKSVVDTLALKINRILNQKELQGKQDLLERAYNLAEIGTWVLDITDSKLYWSPTTKEIHEVPPHYEPDLKTAIHFYQESGGLETIRSKLNRAIEEGKTFDVEFRIVTAKNNERWVRLIGEPEFAGNKCVRLFGSIQNIDRRKRAEEALQKSEQRFKSLVQDGSDLISIIDSEGYYKYASPTSQRVQSLGIEHDDFIGLNCLDFIHKDDRERIRKTIANLKTNERKELKPYQFKNAKGAWRWIETTLTNLTDTPEVNGYVANSRDVTERIEQERKLRDIVENSTNLFYRHNVNHEITYISPQSKEFLGCSPEEAKKRWTEFVTDHPVNENGVRKTIEAIETGIAQDPYELQLQKVNGEKIWVEVNEAPVVENGDTIAMVGSLTDITARKEYEERLEELSLIASKTTDVIIMTDAEDRIIWVNKAFEKMMDFSLEESRGKTPDELLRGAATNPKTAYRIQRGKKNHKSIQEIILNYTKDGRGIWLDMTADPIFDDGKFKGYISINKDVTEQIKQRRKLQESLERYEIVTKATSDTIWDADLKADTVTYNSNIYDVFGYNEHEVENSTEWWLKKIHPRDRARMVNEINLTELGKKERIQSEYRFQCADGSYKHVNDRAFIISDEGGNPVRIIGAMQDITKQKEENLWLKLLESAIANTTEAIAILQEKTERSQDRKILYVNNAFEVMTGYSKKDVLGSSLLKFMSPKTNRKAIVKGIQSLDRGEACQLEISYSHKSHEDKWAQISFAPVWSTNEKFSYWICIGRDTTDQREREQELRESLQEKETLLMEIHHRVKNNLAVVSSMMQLQAMEEQEESIQRKLHDSVARIRTMVTIHELLYKSGSFARLNFAENLSKLVSMIIETIQNEQKITVNFESEEVHLNVNQAIPSSLIVNEVITNAIKHAFSGKSEGLITVELEELENQVKIKISDNGTGLPKKFGSNKSLGMQLIDVLAQQMNSDYKYASSPQGGTVFEIQFEKSSVKGIGSAYLS